MNRRSMLAPGVVRGEFFRGTPSGRLKCEVCPRFCTLKDGQRGFCFIRERRGDDIVLSSYGRSSGFCIDPIEKKPLYHFFPGTPVLSFGTAGCNLGCRFCQNWNISKSKEVDGLGSRAYPTDIAEAAEQAHCKSVAFTYNDPVPFLEYAVDAAEACHERDIRTVAVTAGYVAEGARERFFAPMDAANVDLKAFTDAFYRKLCFAELAPVLETLAYLHHETDVWVEVTTLLIPGQNDSPAEVESLCQWMVDTMGPEVPLHFSAFHPDYKMRALPRTPTRTLLQARAIAKEAGLHHVYTGNVHDPAGQSTYCAGCSQLLVERDAYELGRWTLDNGHCGGCGEALAGRFDADPGQWQARRMRLMMPSWSS